MCACPPIDTVPSQLQIDVPAEIADLQIEAIDEAIGVYMEAYSRKFHSPEKRQQRERSLQLLQQYLIAQGHSLTLNEFDIKRLAFNLGVHQGDAMQVGKRNPLGAVTFTGIDFAANRQTRVVALL